MPALEVTIDSHENSSILAAFTVVFCHPSLLFSKDCHLFPIHGIIQPLELRWNGEQHNYFTRSVFVSEVFEDVRYIAI